MADTTYDPEQRAFQTTLIDATTFNATTATETSDAVFMQDYGHFTLYTSIDSTLTPTDIVIQVQFSDDGVTFYNYTRGPFGDLRWEDGGTATALNESIDGEVAGRYMRVIVTCTGTDATKKFLVTVKVSAYN